MALAQLIDIALVVLQVGAEPSVGVTIARSSWAPLLAGEPFGLVVVARRLNSERPEERVGYRVEHAHALGIAEVYSGT